jgi:hypothetical protein
MQKLGGGNIRLSTMRNYGLLLALVLLGSAFWASSAAASEPWGRLAPYWRTPTPYYEHNPRVIQPNNKPPRELSNPPKDANYRHAYPYGFFGAQIRSSVAKSSGYYENAPQTMIGRGY